MADQPENAARVAALGAGLRVSADATTENIRDTIQRIVENPSFRHAAQEFAASIAEEDPVHAAVYEMVSASGSTYGGDSA